LFGGIHHMVWSQRMEVLGVFSPDSVNICHNCLLNVSVYGPWE
jgi:hypothetical protein